jgi:hypothetical protein
MSFHKRGVHQRSPTAIERLEPRQLLAVIINEFLTQNSNGITDEDGDRTDWIELRNTGVAPVDLAGWYLTDDALNLTKWAFPATNLAANGYLTVFASGKDRSVAGQQLHTNFSLDNDGEDLLMVMPDGTSVADSYLAYPDQRADVSYGIGASVNSTSTQTLVGASSDLRVISPFFEDAAVDDHWTEIGFDDSTWLSGTRSIGFDRNGDGVNLLPRIGRVLTTSEMPSSINPRYTAYVRYSFNLADKDQLTSLGLELRFDDGFIAYINGREVQRADFGEDFIRPQPQWDSRSGYQQGTSSSLGAVNRVDEPLSPETFDLTPFLPELLNGTNVLAFHVVNSASTTGGSTNVQDLLLEPVLTATRATATAPAQFMVNPTPGGNNGVGTSGFVADTQFSVDRGFFDAPFDVSITTTTPGAQIRYTTNGTPPTASTGTVYTGPIDITTTTTLRAAAFLPGWTPTNVDTQTYIFLEDVIHQSAASVTQPYATWGHDKDDGDTNSGYNLDDESDWAMDPDIVNNPSWSGAIKNDLKSIPTMSVVMDWNDLFSGTPQPGTPDGALSVPATVSPAPRGIYIHGRSEERYTSLEYFNPNLATDQFQTDAAIEVQGHSSPNRWNSDKLSFQVKFKFPYGPTQLNYPLFNGAPAGASATTHFDTLILDAIYNYSWHHANPAQNTSAKFVTDQVLADLQNLAGGQAAHGRYVHLYLNGLYWGIYNVHERPDDRFASEYFGGDKDDYDIIKHASDDPTHHYTWVEGGVNAESNYGMLVGATRAVAGDPTNATAYQAVTDLLDVDDFLDYMIVHFYGGNVIDWSNNNWYASYNRVESGAKWHFHAWDQEHAFPTSSSLDATAPNLPNEFDTPKELHANLMTNAEYKLRFNDRVQRLMRNGGLLTQSQASAAYQARVNEINRAIVGESARWGDNRSFTDPYDRNDFISTANVLASSFFVSRTNNVISQFSTRGWLVTLGAPVFSHLGGNVSPGTQLTLSKPGGSPGGAVIYYTLDGSDPRLPGGGISPTAILYSGPVTLNSSVVVKSRIFFDNSGIVNDFSPIIAATFTVGGPFPLRIAELHYNPAPRAGVADPQDMEFIELLNTAATTIGLDGVQIAGFTTEPYTFTGGLSLGAGQRIVVARDATVFQSVYGGAINLAPTGYGTANLSNAGERVILLDPLSQTLQDFTYDDAAPWPTSPDGDGASLELINPLGDPSNGSNWRASTFAGGSPGGDDVITRAFNYQTGHTITVQFTREMDPSSFQPADVSVQPQPVGAPVSPTSVSYDGATRTATFTFATPLPDGNYIASLLSASVLDINGFALAASQAVPDFFVLAGDADHDRDIDVNDLGILASNWQQSPRTLSEGDFDYNGTVDVNDLGILASHWQQQLAAPSAATPGPSLAIRRRDARIADQLFGG